MTSLLKDSFLSLQEAIYGLSITDALLKLAEFYPGRIVFSTSFSYEDQVITDFISKLSLPVSIFTLDTGRLFLLNLLLLWCLPLSEQ